jgi:hypothetical protein
MQMKLAAASLVLLAGVAAAAPVERTVHVTVTDNKGQPVLDLAPADLVVKEGGKEYPIAKVEPAGARMRLVLAVEEVLVQDGSTRMGLFEFAKRLGDAAEISLVVIGLRNTTVVDYTTDLNVLVGALNKLSLNPNRSSNVAEGVLEIARTFIATKPQRPVLVLVALSGGQASIDPRNVLDQIGASGVTMHAVTLQGSISAAGVDTMADESGREQILGDGPKQSGGRRHDLNTPNAIPKALQQVANDLLAQQAITYALPDGVKPNKRFQVSAKRRGLTLRAPSSIPER